MIDSKYIVVGSGIFGAVFAERIASELHEHVVVLERRSDIGGNCCSSINQETDIECHLYGSHIFHTSNERVWRYITRFTEFTDYRHKVLTISNGQTYFMPINLKTLCDVFGKSLTPASAAQLMQVQVECPPQKNNHSWQNLEEKAISLIGRELYEKFIRGYTRKQWDKDPRELPADIITRLPVRTTFNTDYFNDPYQGVPKDGYFRLFEKLLKNSLIEVRLNTDFSVVKKEIRPDSVVIYTGMIDEYFNHCLGGLEWRSLRFEWETLPIRDFQGTAVMNYADESVPFTRVHEFKHYHPERMNPYLSDHTVICHEYSQKWEPSRDAYYPINTVRNQDLVARYQALAAKTPNLIFGGRLGCYCYWDMDQAILNALECFDKHWKGKIR